MGVYQLLGVIKGYDCVTLTELQQRVLQNKTFPIWVSVFQQHTTISIKLLCTALSADTQR